MKRLFFLLFAFVALNCTTRAQNYEALDRYMQKYSSTWSGRRGSFEHNESQLGMQCPDFQLNGKLSSKKLRGRFVLLNFWATWCTGCRLLSVDLDSLMMRNNNEYRDVQLIGVDAHESLADKGFDADEWWKQNHISFPSVGGTAADQLCDTLHGGHPCMIVIDDKGIIRGRWDAWTPSAADEARMAVWALHVVPRDGIKADSATVVRYFNEGRVSEATYLLSLIPESMSMAPLRFHVLSAMSAGEAVSYLKEFRKTHEANSPREEWAMWEADPAYVSTIESIIYDVYTNKNATADMLVAARDAAAMLFKVRDYHASRMSMIRSVLSFRYGKCIEESATRALNRMAASPQSYSLDEQAQAELRSAMAKWQIPVINNENEQNAVSNRMKRVDQEAKDNMQGLYEKVNFQITDGSGLTAEANLPQKMIPGKAHEIEVKVNVPKGWHAYADTEKNRSQGNIPTVIEVKLPKGFKLDGKMETAPEGDELEEHFYLRQRIVCPAAAKLKGQKQFDVKVRLTYQICNGGSCMSPQTVEATGTLKVRD